MNKLNIENQEIHYTLNKLLNINVILVFKMIK